MIETQPHLGAILEECASWDLASGLRESLEDLQSRIREERLYVAVLGEFKRGKSTFVNALLGDSLMPVGVVPLTNVVTLVESPPPSRVPGLELHRSDGSVASAPLDSLKDYVTESGNPGNREGLRWVRAFCPHPLLRQGMVLVDTPGIGSLYADQTEQTRSFLPRIDAALLVLSADSPLSEREQAFLDDLFREAGRCLVVLNKIDLIAPEDREALAAFVTGQIQRRYPQGTPHVFCVSARRDLQGNPDPGMEALRGHLRDLVARDRDQVRQRANRRRAVGFLRMVQTSFQVERDSLRLPLDQLRQRLALFEESREALSVRLKEARVLSEKDLEDLVVWLEGRLEDLRRTLPETILKEMEDRREELGDLAAGPFGQRLRELVDRSLERHFRDALGDLEGRLQDRYRDLTERHRKRLTALLRRLLEEGASIFHLPLEAWELPEELQGESWFHCFSGQTRPFFDLPGALVSLKERLLPRSLGRRAVFRRLLASVPQRVDANCGRVRFDLVRRMKDSHLVFLANLAELVESVARSIDEAARSTLRRQDQADRVWDERGNELVRCLERIEEHLASLDREERGG